MDIWCGLCAHFFLVFFPLFLDIFFIYMSNVIPFPGLPSGNPLSHLSSPCLYEGTPHPLLPSCPGIPLHWGIKHPQAQGLLLPLMSDKAILCHICGRSHGSLHVYSLVGGPVPGSSGGSDGGGVMVVWLADTVAPPMELQTPSAPLVPSPTPPFGTSPMVG